MTSVRTVAYAPQPVADAVNGNALPEACPASPTGRVRARCLPLPVLREPGRVHRPRPPAQPRWGTHVGERGGLLPGLQRGQGRLVAVRRPVQASPDSLRPRASRRSGGDAQRYSHRVDRLPRRPTAPARLNRAVRKRGRLSAIVCLWPRGYATNGTQAPNCCMHVQCRATVDDASRGYARPHLH